MNNRMLKSNGLVKLLLVIVSLSVGIAIGYASRSPQQLMSTIKQKLRPPQLSTMVARQPDLLHTYKEFDEAAPLQLHVFHPELPMGDNKPGIILFHGGGWTRGTADVFYPHCSHLAARGIACISAEYRTSDSHNTSALHAVADAKHAYQYVTENAHTLGLDDNPWYAAGASAGGHLAASIASADYPEYQLEKAYPQGVILLGPVIDNSPTGYAYERVKYFGESFSPLHNLDDQFPRTLFLVGDKDRFVPTDTARKFVSALNDLGVEAKLKIYSDAYHSFYLDKQFSQTMQDMETFLSAP